MMMSPKDFNRRWFKIWALWVAIYALGLVGWSIGVSLLLEVFKCPKVVMLIVGVIAGVSSGWFGGQWMLRAVHSEHKKLAKELAASCGVKWDADLESHWR